MFLILANGVQIAGTYEQQDDAHTAFDALVAEHPETEFTVFQKLEAPEDSAESTSKKKKT